MVAGETLGLIVVIGFGHDEIGNVFFLGLHGFNIKKHMQRGLVLLRDGVWGSSFPLSFLVGLRFGDYLNKTTMRFPVHVLVAGGTIDIPAFMLCILVYSHVLFTTVFTATTTKADGGLEVAGGFASVVFDEMHLETRVSEKVPMTTAATLGGFLASRVCMKEVRALFLATGPAMPFLFGAAMSSLIVIGFPTMGTDVTGPEKPWQLGNDIIMAFLVQQDELFVLKGTKGGDVIRTVGIRQQDLVTGQGGSGTELGQGIVTTWTEGYVGLVMEQESHFFLQFSSLTNAVVFRVLVHASFGGDEGSGTTKIVVIADVDNRTFLAY